MGPSLACCTGPHSSNGKHQYFLSIMFCISAIQEVINTPPSAGKLVGHKIQVGRACTLQALPL